MLDFPGAPGMLPAVDEIIDLTALNAAIALVAMVQGDPEEARKSLIEIPRSKRGNLKIALDDLTLMLERLGRT